MPESRVLSILRELPCAELISAGIDVVEHLVRFNYYDSNRREFIGTHPLQVEDIRVLNRGGFLVLRDQSGHEIALRL
jgi:hypothetical protein